MDDPVGERVEGHHVRDASLGHLFLEPVAHLVGGGHVERQHEDRVRIDVASPDEECCACHHGGRLATARSCADQGVVARSRDGERLFRIGVERLAVRHGEVRPAPVSDVIDLDLLELVGGDETVWVVGFEPVCGAEKALLHFGGYGGNELLPFGLSLGQHASSFCGLLGFLGCQPIALRSIGQLLGF